MQPDFGSLIASSLFAPLISVLQSKQAYLDPGSGSYLLQLLIAGLLGGAFMVRTYWSRITGFFRSRFRRREDTPADEE